MPNKRVDSISGAPRALYNLDFSVDDDKIHDPEVIADLFLQSSVKILKVGSAGDLVKFSSKKTQAGTTVRYHQEYNGIEVHDSDIAVTVNTKNRVSFAVSNYRQDIRLLNSIPFVDERGVYEAALKEMKVRRKDVSAVESKIIIFGSNDFHTLAWRVKVIALKDKMMSYEFIYDAGTGENLQIKNLIYDKTGGGDVRKGTHKASKVESANGFQNLPDLNTHLNKKHRYMQESSREETDIISLLNNWVLHAINVFSGSMEIFGLLYDRYETWMEGDPIFLTIMIRVMINIITGKRQSVSAFGGIFDPNPLATAQAKYFDPGFRDNFGLPSPQLNAQVQNVTLNNVSFDGLFYKLEGPYASYNDFDLPFTCLFEPASTTLDFHKFRGDDMFEAVNAYYHIDTMMRYINFDLGITVGPSAYSGGVQFDPQGSDGEDNSYYSSWSEQLAFGQGGVDDAEDADVIIHELSHGLHSWLTGSISQEEGISEGFADYLANSYARSKSLWTPGDPEYYWVYSWDGHNEFWEGRVTNYEETYPEGLTGDKHMDGQIWSTCNMRIWDAIGREASDKIHLIGLSYTGSFSNQDDLANAIIAAARDLDYPILYINKIIEIYVSCGYNVACGNGVREGKEECDGEDIGSAQCQDRGCSLGIPKCTSTCELDYGDCKSDEGEFLLQLTIAFDEYPHENYWNVRSTNNDTILYTGSNYIVPSMTVKERMCLMDGCYNISLFDRAGDGICCEFGKGGYEIDFNDTSIPVSNFTFGKSVDHQLGDCY